LKSRTTINDIAKELKITPATVSRALSDHPEISAQTKKRVQETAKNLDYNRNKIASSLRSGHSQLIGVLIPSVAHSFFGQVIHGITNTANDYGYDVLIYQSNETYQNEVKGIKAFLSARVDGILASISKETTNYAHFLEVNKQNVPIAFFDRINDDLNIPSVSVNDYKGAYLATTHLIEQGYKKIAHVAGQQHHKVFNDRLKG
jgi:LacI family transcriptional regulator